MSTTIQLHKPQYNKHKHDIISDNIIANTIIIITNKVSQSHYSMQLILIIYPPGSQQRFCVHGDTAFSVCALEFLEWRKVTNQPKNEGVFAHAVIKC